jgi:mono/diheme cytochrome c family protein
VADLTIVDVAVMRPADRAPVAGATVRLTARPLDQATGPLVAEASVGADPLGVRHRADLAFPTAGRWQVTVAARGPDGEGSATFLLDVEPASGRTGVALAVAAGAAGAAGLVLAWRRRAAAVVGTLVLVGGAGVAGSQPADHPHAPGTPTHDHPRAPVRVTMEDLHAHGGVPPGWRFAFPDGDPRAGRAVFEKLECYKCHAIRGESFPNAPREPGDSGPELTGMGANHPVEYLAESVLSPNAVIVTGPGHTGPDGLSVMPDYRDTLTVGELVDLVAYLRALAPPAAAPGVPASGGHDHGGAPAPRGGGPGATPSAPRQ